MAEMQGGFINTQGMAAPKFYSHYELCSDFLGIPSGSLGLGWHQLARIWGEEPEYLAFLARSVTDSCSTLGQIA